MNSDDKKKMGVLWGVCAVVVVISIIIICVSLNSGSGYKGKLTYENYNKIQMGMTYSQVANILGNGEQTQYVGDASYNLAQYTWTNESPMKIIVVSFENGLVNGKTQVGLT